MTTGEKIKALRKFHRLTQGQLAKKLGCSQTVICRWEKGISTPSPKDAIEISDLFQISLDVFFRKDQPLIFKEVFIEIDEKIKPYLSGA